MTGYTGYTVNAEFDKSDPANKLHILATPNGCFTASFSNRGLTIVDLAARAPSEPQFHNVNLAFESGEYYRREDNPYFGAFIGRVANRIQDGKFKLDGTSYQIAQTNFGHSLHGGKHGYDKVVFRDPQVLPAPSETSSVKLKFTYVSKHLEEGFPGELLIAVKYWIEDAPGGGALYLEYEATLLGPENVDHAIVNLTNHSYFNIGDKPTIEDTELTLTTNSSLEVTDTFVPTGNIVPHPLVPPDLSTIKLGPDEPDIDHAFVFPGADISVLDTRSLPLQVMASAYHPNTKLHLIGETTEPCFQLYTGKYTNVDGLYGPRSGFCLESSRYIDAVNKEEWKGMVTIGKNQTYGSLTKYSLYY
ncbi:galactose mutarotase-like domain-containing protein [Lipomyces kononenkoae]|uniref:Galactose mutarotase-like domain-containing protein n=1 Tax=Lipomyces kononenkoae TaxID=34357 RepID=A0ACC3SXP0_LIPKO